MSLFYSGLQFVTHLTHGSRTYVTRNPSKRRKKKRKRNRSDLLLVRKQTIVRFGQAPLCLRANRDFATTTDRSIGGGGTGTIKRRPFSKMRLRLRYITAEHNDFFFRSVLLRKFRNAFYYIGFRKIGSE